MADNTTENKTTDLAEKEASWQSNMDNGGNDLTADPMLSDEIGVSLVYKLFFYRTMFFIVNYNMD